MATAPELSSETYHIPTCFRRKPSDAPVCPPRYALDILRNELWDRIAAATSHRLAEALFLRLLGLTYFVAFASLWPQILGLVGSNGIVPAVRTMKAMQSQFGPQAFLYAPTLLWLFPSDRALVLFCIFGCVAALLLACGLFQRTAALLCFLLYLSLSSAGQPFTSFQWDALLLEAGFLAIFSGAPPLVWTYRLLLFRLMFESGWVKIASHDPNWRNFHALRFHFMTQPLPNPVAYYADHLPPGLLDALTAVTLLIEFGAPFLLFAPRRARLAGVALLAALQVAILLTGNYAFFNLLTLALCCWALDERTLAPLSPVLQWRWPRLPDRSGTPYIRAGGSVLAGFILLLGFLQLLNHIAPRSFRPGTGVLEAIQPFGIVNSYGLFAVMTTTRSEIVIEGSNDQIDWREYQFPYKPGNTHRTLPWVAPYQPRLDWQLWFAALSDYPNNTWVSSLMYRILTAEPGVTKLLDAPPFVKPPHYLRALLYVYDFTSESERENTGALWRRHYQGVWFGPVSLNGQ